MSAKRPATFDEFNGQTSVITNLKVAVTSCLRRGDTLSHVLLTGPAGTGKTTIGLSVLASELSTEATFVNCAAIDKPTELTAVLASVNEGKILFLDEVHALPMAAREYLLTAMEDQRLSVKVGEGADTDIIDVRLPKFTVVAATTRQGLLDGPLRTRFQHVMRLEPYTDTEMAHIIKWHAEGEIAITDEAAAILANAAKGVARNGVNLLGSAIDTAYAFGIEEKPTITESTAATTLSRLGYRGNLTPGEYNYLAHLAKVDKPQGLQAIAHALDEQSITIEEVYEPWLLRQGLVARTPSGRVLTECGHQKLRDALL